MNLAKSANSPKKRPKKSKGKREFGKQLGFEE